MDTGRVSTTRESLMFRDFWRGPPCPHGWYGDCRKSGAMLRISVEDGPRYITMRLEGRLAGVWVKELEDAWRELESRRRGRPLLVDLSAVDHVDQAGEYLLALVARRGAQLSASSIVMGELCQRIAAGWPPTAATEQ